MGQGGVMKARECNSTRACIIHTRLFMREFVGLADEHQQLLAYLHTISDCFPVAFLPDVLLAYTDLSSFFLLLRFAFLLLFLFSPSNPRWILSYFSLRQVTRVRSDSARKDKIRGASLNSRAFQQASFSRWIVTEKYLRFFLRKDIVLLVCFKLTFV